MRRSRRAVAALAALASLAAGAAALVPSGGAAPSTRCVPPGVVVDDMYYRQVLVPRPVARGRLLATGEMVGWPCTWPPVDEAPPPRHVRLAAIRGVRPALAQRHARKARVVFVRPGVCPGARPGTLVACLRRTS